jgi:hypothetical protein
MHYRSYTAILQLARRTVPDPTRPPTPLPPYPPTPLPPYPPTPLPPYPPTPLPRPKSTRRHGVTLCLPPFFHPSYFILNHFKLCATRRAHLLLRLRLLDRARLRGLGET